VKAPFVSPVGGKTFVEQWPVEGPLLASQFNSSYNDSAQNARPSQELKDYFQEAAIPSGLLRQFGYGGPRCSGSFWVLVNTRHTQTTVKQQQQRKRDWLKSLP
jgi:hypothetical protein